uniref:Thioredoxin domain-containing protein n=1 Tax=Mycena chlorophos TaxID=658473 RepID=A0ABQ0LLQ1_MYCCL|nr:predicted protein [Mycena chlorophos]
MPSNPPIYMPRTALVIPPHRPKAAQPVVNADAAPTTADSPDAHSVWYDKEEDKIPDSVHQINDYEDIQRFIAESKIKSTVIQFGARHNCRGCRIIKPYWHQLAESHHPRVNFVYCDVGPDGAAANEAGVQYKITAMPAFVFLKGDLEINRVLGSNKGCIAAAITHIHGGTGGAGGTGGKEGGAGGPGQGPNVYFSGSNNVQFGPLANDYDTIMDFVSPINFLPRQQEIYKARHKNTGNWPLAHPAFQEWKSGSSQVLWCSGIRQLILSILNILDIDSILAGAGKTVLV